MIVVNVANLDLTDGAGVPLADYTVDDIWGDFIGMYSYFGPHDKDVQAFAHVLKEQAALPAEFDEWEFK